MNPKKPISIDTRNAVIRAVGAADGAGAGVLTSAKAASTKLAIATQTNNMAATFGSGKPFLLILLMHGS